MKLYNLLEKLNNLTDISLQEKWDNSGIQILLDNSNVEKIVLTLDVTEEAVDFAIENSSNLIISHHPLFFSGVKHIDFRENNEKIIIKAICNNINIFSFHTNMDKKINGLADYFCKKLNFYNTKHLSGVAEEKLFKVTTFIPEKNLNSIIDYLKESNVGIIGNYRGCSFFHKGSGTFIPQNNSSPYIGDKNRFNIIEEIRLEFQVNENQLKNVLKNLKRLHPYEEPVFDIYPLLQKGKILGSLGRIAELNKKITLKSLMNKIKSVFDIETLRYVSNNENDEIGKIAVCPGSGMSLLSDVIKNRCEVFITGDVKYHEAQTALYAGVSIIDLGHFNTEYIFTEIMGEHLKQIPNIEVLTFKQKDIFKYA